MDGLISLVDFFQLALGDPDAECNNVRKFNSTVPFEDGENDPRQDNACGAGGGSDEVVAPPQDRAAADVEEGPSSPRLFKPSGNSLLPQQIVEVESEEDEGEAEAMVVPAPRDIEQSLPAIDNAVPRERGRGGAGGEGDAEEEAKPEDGEIPHVLGSSNGKPIVHA